MNQAAGLGKSLGQATAGFKQAVSGEDKKSSIT